MNLLLASERSFKTNLPAESVFTSVLSNLEFEVILTIALATGSFDIYSATTPVTVTERTNGSSIFALPIAATLYKLLHLPRSHRR